MHYMYYSLELYVCHVLYDIRCICVMFVLLFALSVLFCDFAMCWLFMGLVQAFPLIVEAGAPADGPQEFRGYSPT